MTREIEFTDEMKKHKYITKLSSDTWLVQSNPQSRCQAYYVTVNDHIIVMFGDYDGVIVRPSTSGQQSLICWMAGATTTSYFAEKVLMANQYHKVKTWNEDAARKELEGFFQDRHYYIKTYKGKFEGEITEKLHGLIMKTLNEAFYYRSSEEVDQLTEGEEELLDLIGRIDLQSQYAFIESMRTLDTEADLCFDCDDYDMGEEYTHQLRWQQQCLLWWANNLLTPHEGVIFKDETQEAKP